MVAITDEKTGVFQVLGEGHVPGLHPQVYAYASIFPNIFPLKQRQSPQF